MHLVFLSEDKPVEVVRLPQEPPRPAQEVEQPPTHSREEPAQSPTTLLPTTKAAATKAPPKTVVRVAIFSLNWNDEKQKRIDVVDRHENRNKKLIISLSNERDIYLNS